MAKLIKGMARHAYEMFLCYNYWDAIKWWATCSRKVCVLLLCEVASKPLACLRHKLQAVSSPQTPQHSEPCTSESRACLLHATQASAVG